jgi:hypothetical protein
MIRADFGPSWAPGAFLVTRSEASRSGRRRLFQPAPHMSLILRTPRAGRKLGCVAIRKLGCVAIASWRSNGFIGSVLDSTRLELERHSVSMQQPRPVQLGDRGETAVELFLEDTGRVVAGSQDLGTDLLIQVRGNDRFRASVASSIVRASRRQQIRAALPGPGSDPTTQAGYEQARRSDLRPGAAIAPTA